MIDQIMLDQIGPTNAMRRALDIQNRRNPPPKQIKHQLELVEPMSFMEHKQSTGKSQIAYVNLKAHECAPRGYAMVEYNWRHVPSGKTGKSKLAMRHKDHAPELLEFWNTEKWNYWI